MLKMERQFYTDSHERDMLLFLYRSLSSDNPETRQAAKQTGGMKIWKMFEDTRKAKHSSSSMQTRWMRVLRNKVYTVTDVPVVALLTIYRDIELRVSTHALQIIRVKCGGIFEIDWNKDNTRVKGFRPLPSGNASEDATTAHEDLIEEDDDDEAREEGVAEELRKERTRKAKREVVSPEVGAADPFAMFDEDSTDTAQAPREKKSYERSPYSDSEHLIMLRHICDCLSSDIPWIREAAMKNGGMTIWRKLEKSKGAKRSASSYQSRWTRFLRDRIPWVPDVPAETILSIYRDLELPVSDEAFPMIRAKCGREFRIDWNIDKTRIVKFRPLPLGIIRAVEAGRGIKPKTVEEIMQEDNERDARLEAKEAARREERRRKVKGEVSSPNENEEIEGRARTNADAMDTEEETEYDKQQELRHDRRIRHCLIDGFNPSDSFIITPKIRERKEREQREKERKDREEGSNRPNENVWRKKQMLGYTTPTKKGPPKKKARRETPPMNSSTPLHSPRRKMPPNVASRLTKSEEKGLYAYQVPSLKRSTSGISLDSIHLQDSNAHTNAPIQVGTQGGPSMDLFQNALVPPLHNQRHELKVVPQRMYDSLDSLDSLWGDGPDGFLPPTPPPLPSPPRPATDDTILDGNRFSHISPRNKRPLEPRTNTPDDDVVQATPEDVLLDRERAKESRNDEDELPNTPPPMEHDGEKENEEVERVGVPAGERRSRDSHNDENAVLQIRKISDSQRAELSSFLRDSSNVDVEAQRAPPPTDHDEGKENEEEEREGEQTEKHISVSQGVELSMFLRETPVEEEAMQKTREITNSQRAELSSFLRDTPAAEEDTQQVRQSADSELAELSSFLREASQDAHEDEDAQRGNFTPGMEQYVKEAEEWAAGMLEEREKEREQMELEREQMLLNEKENGVFDGTVDEMWEGGMDGEVSVGVAENGGLKGGGIQKIVDRKVTRPIDLPSFLLVPRERRTNQDDGDGDAPDVDADAKSTTAVADEEEMADMDMEESPRVKTEPLDEMEKGDNGIYGAEREIEGKRYNIWRMQEKKFWVDELLRRWPELHDADKVLHDVDTTPLSDEVKQWLDWGGGPWLRPWINRIVATAIVGEELDEIDTLADLYYQMLEAIYATLVDEAMNDPGMKEVEAAHNGPPSIRFLVERQVHGRLFQQVNRLRVPTMLKINETMYPDEDEEDNNEEMVA